MKLYIKDFNNLKNNKLKLSYFIIYTIGDLDADMVRDKDRKG